MAPDSLSFTATPRELGEVRGRRWRRLVDERCDHLGPGKEGGPGLDRPLSHEPVEVVAGDRIAVAGEIGVSGPLHLDELAEPVGAEPAVLVRAGQGLLEPHVSQLAHRPGGQAVAAGLLRGESASSRPRPRPNQRPPASRRTRIRTGLRRRRPRRGPRGAGASWRVGGRGPGGPQPILKRRVASPLHRRPEPGSFRPTQDVPRERVPW